MNPKDKIPNLDIRGDAAIRARQHEEARAAMMGKPQIIQHLPPPTFTPDPLEAALAGWLRALTFLVYCAGVAGVIALVAAILGLI